MDPQLILANIEQAIPFNERNYPGYDLLDNDQRLIFSLTHMLRHQGKSLMRYGGATQDGRSQLVYKLAMNCFRFGQVAGIRDDHLEREMSAWLHLNRPPLLSRRAIESDTIEVLKAGLIETFSLFEGPEHGGSLDAIMPELHHNALRFLEHIRKLAEMRQLNLEKLANTVDAHFAKHHS